MFIGRKHLLRIVLLQSLMMVALCCSCMKHHPQKFFCNHRYVLRVLVQKNLIGVRENRDRVYRYSVVIQKVFKGKMSQLNVQHHIVELVMPYICGIDLMEAGESWLIFGENRNRNLYTDMCSGSRLWSKTGPFLQRGVRRLYKRGCNCLAMLENMKPDQCKWDNSYLNELDDDRCTWRETRGYRKCRRPTSFESFL